MKLIGVKNPRIGYIASSPDPDRIYFDSKRSYYQKLDAELSPYVDSESSQITVNAIFECDAIHLSGGNTFDFSRWLHQAGLFKPLSLYAQERGVLVGVSAGAILMTSSVGTAYLCGDIAEGDVGRYMAMGLVQFGFWPHYAPINSQGVAQGYENAPRVLYACPDGAGVIVDGASVETFGPLTVLDGGGR